MMLKILLFATALAAVPCAQGVNMTVIRNWHRAPGVEYNEVWGWTAPDGREFAYVGEKDGIWFVETTDPNNIRHQRRLWRRLA